MFLYKEISNIWIECSRKIMMYDICHGLQIEDYRNFIKETSAFLGHDTLGLTHYGGEFFAANRENTLSFIDECLKIYNRMISISFNAKSGDEFISSLAADCLSEKVRNAGAYVYRFWTRRFHLMSTNYQYNSVIVLHVPQEKDYGMKKIFDNYVAKGTLPSRKKVWRLLHLSRTDWKIALYLKLQSLKG